MTDITTQRQRRRVPHAELIPHRGLAVATVILGLALAANALLGPLVFEVIEYRFLSRRRAPPDRRGWRGASAGAAPIATSTRSRSGRA